MEKPERVLYGTSTMKKFTKYVDELEKYIEHLEDSQNYITLNLCDCGCKHLVDGQKGAIDLYCCIKKSDLK